MTDTQTREGEADPLLQLPLEQQTQALSIQMHTVEVARVGKTWIVGGIGYNRVETAALALLERDGWRGAACEGGPVLLLMKAACLDLLAKVNTFSSREDACTRFFEAQCYIHAGMAAEILEEIATSSLERTLSRFEEIYSHSFIAQTYPGLTTENVAGFFRALSPKLVAIARVFLQDSYRYRKGWPDVTVFREDRIRFVEVKSTDRLKASQIDVINAFAKPLELPFEILRLRRKDGSR